MDIVAIPPLVAFVAAFCFGLFVYFRNPKSLVNKSFLALSLLSGLLTFVEFGYLQSRSAEEDIFWRRAHGFWPFVSAFFIHFFSVFTNQIFTRYKILHFVLAILLLATASTITLNEFSTPLIEPAGEHQHRFGWILGNLESSALTKGASIFFFGTWGCACLAMLSLFSHERRRQQRKQTRFFSWPSWLL